MKPHTPTTPPLRGTPPCQEGSFNSPPAKGEYAEGGRGLFPAKGEYAEGGMGLSLVQQGGARLNNLPALRTFRKDYCSSARMSCMKW